MKININSYYKSNARDIEQVADNSLHYQLQ